ncbi:unnamed protein product [Heterobilharzia americana]|nr:unnamed protein product [Heterobilharzia americana]
MSEGSMSKCDSISPSLPATNKRGPVEASILDYVLYVHAPNCKNRAALIALLIHSELLSRGARPTEASLSTAILNPSCFSEDPIRISYTLISRPKCDALSTCRQLQVSVTETDSHVFISVTDTTTDKFGHLELSGIEHVYANAVFPQLTELLESIEESLWKPVLPAPPLYRSAETGHKKESPSNNDEFHTYPQRPFTGNYSETKPSIGIPLSDYGRSDLDPLSSIGGPSGSGGMIFDPRRMIPDSRIGGGSFFGGPDVLPPGAVPPGARFDPFGPGVMPSRPHLGNGRRRNPDPDHALPPGFDDMYM